MIRLTLNLATRPYYNRRMFNMVFVAAGLFLALVTAYGWYRYFAVNAEIERLTAEIARIEAQISAGRSTVTDKDFDARQQQVKEVNRILEQRVDNPWLRRLSHLETLLPPGASLLRFAPDPKEKKLVLEGQAVAFADIQLLLENLGRSGSYKGAVLVSHGETQQSGPERLKFVIEMEMVTP